MHNHGMKKEYRTVDYKVCLWRHNLQNEKEGKHITKKDVQNYAKELSKSAGLLGFKVSFYICFILEFLNNGCAANFCNLPKYNL